MAEIDNEIAGLEAQQREVGAQLSFLRKKRAIDNCPFAVGQIMVRRTGHPPGQRARITTITPSFGKGYRLRGAVLKKDGSDGKRETELYDFQKWEPEEATC